MNHTHLTAPTCHVEVDGAQFAYRRWGNTPSDQPPLFFLQHFRGGMDHWDPLITDGLTDKPAFTFTFSTAAKGFEILSAKDAQPAFLRGVGSKDLVVSGDFREVMWFQGLTSFLQPPNVVEPWDRSPF